MAFFEHVVLVISSKGRPQENRNLKFLKIQKKIAFYPNRKIYSKKFIGLNEELVEKIKKIDVMGTLINAVFSCDELTDLNIVYVNSSHSRNVYSLI